MKFGKLFFVLLLLPLFLPIEKAMAYQYFGRALLGSYVSSERFNSQTDGTVKNDFATISSRLYTRFTEVSSQNFEMIYDIRDKHDFFDKYSAEKLALTDKNSLQAVQLSAKYNQPNRSLYAMLGRFPITDAGAVSVDGLDTGWKWDADTRSSFFGGLDPKRPEQKYYEFNKDSYVFGTYSVYQPKNTSWVSTTLASSALVGKQVHNHLDRFYWYNFFLYEWDSPSRLLGMIYLDFVPRTYVQNAFLAYTQKFNSSWHSTLQGTMIDVIEYSHRRAVLERLASSPYKELSLSARETIDNNISIDYQSAYGVRTIDAKNMLDLEAGPSFSRVFENSISSNFRLGYKKNFTSKDYLGKINIAYYPKNWELNLDESYSIQKDLDGRSYHPLVSELSLTHFIARELYGTLSAQNAHSERVDINSASLYLGYRFGSKDVAPLRDGAPPRGRL